MERIAVKLFEFRYWKPQTHHFHAFGITGRVHDSQNQSHSFLQTPGYSKEIEKKTNRFWRIRPPLRATKEQMENVCFTRVLRTAWGFPRECF